MNYNQIIMKQPTKKQETLNLALRNTQMNT
jgi:hypothetical protein